MKSFPPCLFFILFYFFFQKKAEKDEENEQADISKPVFCVCAQAHQFSNMISYYVCIVRYTVTVLGCTVVIIDK